VALIIRPTVSDPSYRLRLRRWLAILCILVVVAGALLAPSAGGALPSILVALPILFGLVIIARVRPSDPAPVWSYLASAPLPSRAPPARLSTS
jgi:hypothetical protein